jgi:hypothetical protein
VPPVYKTFMAPWPWAPFLTAFFTPPFFKFLVGPNALSARSDDKVCMRTVRQVCFVQNISLRHNLSSIAAAYRVMCNDIATEDITEAHCILICCMRCWGLYSLEECT